MGMCALVGTYLRSELSRLPPAGCFQPSDPCQHTQTHSLTCARCLFFFVFFCGGKNVHGGNVKCVYEPQTPQEAQSVNDVKPTIDNIRRKYTQDRCLSVLEELI